MRKLRYCLVDVFTNRPFGGNPLAVFTDARGLSPSLMQAIAKELNLSETSFVLPADNPAHHYHVRIFTPAVELPMAGHPTIGTAFVLAHEHLIQTTEPETTVLFEEGVGMSVGSAILWEKAPSRYTSEMFLLFLRLRSTTSFLRQH